MRVLLTSGGSSLGQVLANGLSNSHSVRSVESDIGSHSSGSRIKSFDHSAATDELVRGMDAVVHPAVLDETVNASELLDYQMRCTYNLLRASVDEKVPRFVYLSSLHLMDLYAEDLAVTERWKPQPTTEPSLMGCYLGEVVCREFAREHGVSVAILRLGDLTADGAQSPSSTALYESDAVTAVGNALMASLSGWLDIFHVQSDVPAARYLTGQPWWSADDVSGPVTLGLPPTGGGDQA